MTAAESSVNANRCNIAHWPSSHYNAVLRRFGSIRVGNVRLGSGRVGSDPVDTDVYSLHRLQMNRFAACQLFAITHRLSLAIITGTGSARIIDLQSHEIETENHVNVVVRPSHRANEENADTNEN